MDDDSLYVVLKVYGHLHRNERKHPEERFSGCFMIYVHMKTIDISTKWVIIVCENNFRSGGCHGKTAVSNGYH